MINIVTLGVSDLKKAIRFYSDVLGLSLSDLSGGDFALFQLNIGSNLALYPRNLLSIDANLIDNVGYSGITLAQVVSSKIEVDNLLKQAENSGGIITRQPMDTDWGGYSGYFSDLDGHPWEIAWNPYMVPENPDKSA